MALAIGAERQSHRCGSPEPRMSSMVTRIPPAAANR